MDQYDVLKLIVDAKATLGEGAIWDHINQKLLWVDIEQGHLHIFDPDQEVDQLIKLNQKVGTVVPKSEGVLVALQDGIHEIELENNRMVKKVGIEEDLYHNRFNDGKCDPAGRLWVGSMDLNEKVGSGALYRVDHDFSVHKMIDGVTVSNGIIWSIDQKHMYYIDTPTQKVVAYDFAVETGEIGNPKTIIEIPDELGSPDGCTLDDEGKLWIAMWGGYAVTRWDPATGKLLEKLEVQAPNVTSLAFGGKNLDIMFITTARIGLDEDLLQKYPMSGGLIAVKSGYRGIKASYFGRAI